MLQRRSLAAADEYPGRCSISRWRHLRRTGREFLFKEVAASRFPAENEEDEEEGDDGLHSSREEGVVRRSHLALY